jgi:hypothetical protein
VALRIPDVKPKQNVCDRQCCPELIHPKSGVARVSGCGREVSLDPEIMHLMQDDTLDELFKVAS